MKGRARLRSRGRWVVDCRYQPKLNQTQCRVESGRLVHAGVQVSHAARTAKSCSWAPITPERVHAWGARWEPCKKVSMHTRHPHPTRRPPASPASAGTGCCRRRPSPALPRASRQPAASQTAPQPCVPHSCSRSCRCLQHRDDSMAVSRVSTGTFSKRRSGDWRR